MALERSSLPTADDAGTSIHERMTTSLLDIADRASLPFDEIAAAATALAEHELLERVG